jgi:hypothetical protein
VCPRLKQAESFFVEFTVLCTVHSTKNSVEGPVIPAGSNRLGRSVATALGVACGFDGRLEIGVLHAYAAPPCLGQRDALLAGRARVDDDTVTHGCNLVLHISDDSDHDPVEPSMSPDAVR